MQTLTRAQMQELDRIMMEEFSIDVTIMMEHAGLAVAKTCDQLISEGKRNILVLAGSGHNGGDALCTARHLINWGYDVTITLTHAEHELKEATSVQLATLKNMKAKFDENSNFEDYDFIIDGLIGYNLKSNPIGKVAELIMRANSSKKSILAIDVPSGLDCDLGIPRTPCIKAYATVTLGCVKRGLIQKEAKPYVGRLFLAYIGVPDKVYKKLNLVKPFMASQTLIEINL